MSVPKRHLLTVPLSAAVLALSACGSDDDPDPEARASPTTSRASPATTATTPALPKDPEARLRAVAAALKQVKSMHLEGTSTDGDGEGTISGDLSNAGDSQLEIRTPKQRLAFRVVGADTFLRADESFWKESGDDAQASAIAERLADRWVSIPTSEAGIDEELDDLRPSTLSKCVTVNVGTLRDAGTAEVDGRRAFVLEDEGDVPGGTPGRLYLATEGPPLPLRLVQTGKSRSGGQKVDGCGGSEDDDTTRSDVRFSRFDERITVTAPEGAIEIPTPGAEGEATT